MKNHPIPNCRFLAFLLALSLAIPNSALALRTQNGGLEEKTKTVQELEETLRIGTPDKSNFIAHLSGHSGLEETQAPLRLFVRKYLTQNGFPQPQFQELPDPIIDQIIADPQSISTLLEPTIVTLKKKSAQTVARRRLNATFRAKLTDDIETARKKIAWELTGKRSSGNPTTWETLTQRLSTALQKVWTSGLTDFSTLNDVPKDLNVPDKIKMGWPQFLNQVQTDYANPTIPNDADSRSIYFLNWFKRFVFYFEQLGYLLASAVEKIELADGEALEAGYLKTLSIAPIISTEKLTYHGETVTIYTVEPIAGTSSHSVAMGHNPALDLIRVEPAAYKNRVKNPWDNALMESVSEPMRRQVNERLGYGHEVMEALLPVYAAHRRQYGTEENYRNAIVHSTLPEEIRHWMDWVKVQQKSNAHFVFLSDFFFEQLGRYLVNPSQPPLGWIEAYIDLISEQEGDPRDKERVLRQIRTALLKSMYELSGRMTSAALAEDFSIEQASQLSDAATIGTRDPFEQIHHQWIYSLFTVLIARELGFLPGKTPEDTITADEFFGYAEIYPQLVTSILHTDPKVRRLAIKRAYARIFQEPDGSPAQIDEAPLPYRIDEQGNLIPQAGLEEETVAQTLAATFARVFQTTEIPRTSSGLEESSLVELSEEMVLFSEQVKKQLQRFQGSRFSVLSHYEQQKEQWVNRPARQRGNWSEDEGLKQLGELSRRLDLTHAAQSIREGKLGFLDWLVRFTLPDLSRYRQFVYQQWNESEDPESFEKAMQLPSGTAREYLDWLRELDEALQGFVAKLFSLARAIEGHRNLYLQEDTYTAADLLKDLKGQDPADQLKAMERFETFHKLAIISRFRIGTPMPEIFEPIIQRLLVLAEQDDQPEVKARAYASFYSFTRTDDFIEHLEQALILAMHDLNRDVSPEVKSAASSLIYNVIPWTTRWNPRRQEVALRAGLFFLENPPQSDSHKRANGLFDGLTQRGMYSSQLYNRVLRTAQRGQEQQEPYYVDAPSPEPVVPFPTFHSVRFVVNQDVMQQLGFGDKTFERDGIPSEDLAGLLLWLETERMALPDEQPSDGPLSTAPFALDLLGRIQKGELLVQLQEDTPWNWSQRFPRDHVTVQLTFPPPTTLTAGLEEKDFVQRTVDAGQLGQWMIQEDRSSVAVVEVNPESRLPRIYLQAGIRPPADRPEGIEFVLLSDNQDAVSNFWVLQAPAPDNDLIILNNQIDTVADTPGIWLPPWSPRPAAVRMSPSTSSELFAGDPTHVAKNLRAMAALSLATRGVPDMDVNSITFVELGGKTYAVITSA